MAWLVRAGDQQLGPLSDADIQAWARAGRIRSTDLVWRAGMPEWLPAAQVPDVALHLVPGATSPMGDDPLMRMLLPVGRSGWAITAGYLGLFSLLALPAPFALLTGVLAVLDIRKNPRKHGRGRAVFGIIMGAIGTAALALVLFGRKWG